MLTISDWGLKFVRWGSGLGIAGLITGYFPLAHYLMKDSIPSCPAAPIHGHTILLSFVGMTIFGLVYLAMPQWSGGRQPSLGMVRTHFWLAVIGVAGECLNGTIGYEILGLFVQRHFYYNGPQGQFVRNIWFGLDGVFLSIYGIGSCIFLMVLLKNTTYTTRTA